ncbi:MAG: superoxide dismutase family protein [Methylibium sp.]|uniref:superoxide dismutase family protein n=1 Tax=Methylibium sp. TaxID=2067992 RepID=UPI0017FFF4AD|nr:superoxide dismutase family protein [Methylibium sp.]MBA3596172.1 superoxide dismutase family protein [Methylibium sp.]
MLPSRLFCATVATLLFASGAAAQKPATAEAMLKSSDGTPAGTVRFADTPKGLEIGVEAKGLEPGQHGMHIHQNPDCAPGPDSATGKVVPFGAAGGHFDPMDAKKHGRPGDGKTSHAGDLPMLKAGSDGTGKLTHTTRGLSVTPGKTSVVGRSFVIHEKADDYKTDPSGNSGGRVLCGLIEAAKPTGVAGR